jgi:hypothetical protein
MAVSAAQQSNTFLGGGVQITQLDPVVCRFPWLLAKCTIFLEGIRYLYGEGGAIEGSRS